MPGGVEREGFCEKTITVKEQACRAVASGECVGDLKSIRLESKHGSFRLDPFP